jgi:hypothetical protein
METVKEIVNHPLSRSIAAALVGTGLIIESHPLYAGIAFGVGIREFFIAFKK